MQAFATTACATHPTALDAGTLAASLANFTTLGVDTSFVTTTPDAASGIAQITVDDNGQNEIIIVPGANALLGQAEVTAAAP